MILTKDAILQDKLRIGNVCFFLPIELGQIIKEPKIYINHGEIYRKKHILHEDRDKLSTTLELFSINSKEKINWLTSIELPIATQRKILLQFTEKLEKKL